MIDLKSRLMKVALVVLGITMAGSLWAQQSRSQIIGERLAAVDNICVAGEACATAATAATAGGAAGAAGATTTLAQAAVDFDVEGAYRQYCAMCHDSGMAGAPLLGDDSVWTARLDEIGYDSILSNAINGINAMPPRGMCMDCSDDELDELVLFLVGDVL